MRRPECSSGLKNGREQSPTGTRRRASQTQSIRMSADPGLQLIGGPELDRRSHRNGLDAVADSSYGTEGTRNEQGRGECLPAYAARWPRSNRR